MLDGGASGLANLVLHPDAQMVLNRLHLHGELLAPRLPICVDLVQARHRPLGLQLGGCCCAGGCFDLGVQLAPKGLQVSLGRNLDPGAGRVGHLINALHQPLLVQPQLRSFSRQTVHPLLQLPAANRDLRGMTTVLVLVVLHVFQELLPQPLPGRLGQTYGLRPAAALGSNPAFQVPLQVPASPGLLFHSLVHVQTHPVH
mmetsp:Transcript_7828/g.18455  ORF Transcript_7828/g.18455 Transcript_7828/m.18455 type:complete len:200 (+) Transcript_7828:785-1384(+)